MSFFILKLKKEGKRKMEEIHVISFINNEMLEEGYPYIEHFLIKTNKSYKEIYAIINEIVNKAKKNYSFSDICDFIEDKLINILGEDSIIGYNSSKLYFL
jgi:hypothetical protein